MEKLKIQRVRINSTKNVASPLYYQRPTLHCFSFALAFGKLAKSANFCDDGTKCTGLAGGNVA